MRTCLVAALLGIVTAARAEMVGKAGLTTCETFAKKYEANPKLTEDLYFAWADG